MNNTERPEYLKLEIKNGTAYITRHNTDQNFSGHFTTPTFEISNDNLFQQGYKKSVLGGWEKLMLPVTISEMIEAIQNCSDENEKQNAR